MKKAFSKIKYIKLENVIGIFLFVIALIPSFIYKIFLKICKKEIWLICEQKNTARDNGYWFYKYICENHKDIKCIYVINKKSKDYEKIKNIGKVISWGRLIHYFYYMSSTKNISSHKDGNPNQLIFTICHLYLNLYNNRIFLQHGITKDNIPMFYYNNTKFKLIICGAKKEYEYIKEKFGYPYENIAYTGFSRFDSLHQEVDLKNQIVIIPTWRNWLGRETNSFSEKINFKNSKYYKCWNDLLNNKSLINFIEKNNIDIVFYPHIHMQKYIKDFSTISKNIKILDISDIDIQTLLKESKLLITDYSSVYFDFAYMEKPIIYYQFDYDEYRDKQMPEGYFNYKKDGFGPIYDNCNELINYIKLLNANEFKLDTSYKHKMNEFFKLNDQNNCERIYKKIVE